MYMRDIESGVTQARGEPSLEKDFAATALVNGNNLPGVVNKVKLLFILIFFLCMWKVTVQVTVKSQFIVFWGYVILCQVMRECFWRKLQTHLLKHMRYLELKFLQDRI